MYAVSSDFLAACRAGSQTIAVRATLSSLGGLLSLPVAGGSVSVDAGKAVRRTCSVVLIDPDGSLVPTSGASLLTPFGAEIILERGLVLPSGVTEYVPLGVFVVTRVDVSEDEDGLQLQVEGVDRSIRITRNRWLSAYQIPANTNIVDAVTDAVLDRWPDCPLALDSSDRTLGGPATLVGGDQADPFRDISQIALDLGFDLAFNAAGVLTMRTVPDPSTDTPVATYQDGSDAVLTQIGRQLSMEARYNGVVVVGESTEVGAPVLAQAWDDNPDSPTYYQGLLGPVPRFYSSSLISTLDQATATARALLLKEIGASESVSWSQVVNPAHDVYDVVQITRSPVGVAANYVIDSLEIPLSAASPMTAVARTRTALYG